MEVFFISISILWSVFCLVLFIKVWKMTNDVKILRASLVDDKASAITMMNREQFISLIKRKYYLGKVDAAYDDLNLLTYQQILLADNCEEYKGHIYVFLNGESMEFNSRQEYIDHILETANPLYEAIGQTIPTQLKELKYEDFARFGKVEEESE